MITDERARSAPETSAGMAGARVLHLVAGGGRRGGEVFASDLVGQLSVRGLDQQVAVLHGDEAGAVPYAADVEQLAVSGRLLPGLRLDRATLRSLTGVIRGWAPHVLQAHGGEALKYAVVASRRTAVPVVYRSLGTAPPWIIRGPRRLAYSWLMRRTELVIAVAETVRREAIETFRMPSSKVAMIPNGVNPGRILPQRGRETTRRELGISQPAAATLTIGALTWEKDPLAQVELAERVGRALPGSFHLMAGDGPMRADVEEEIRRRGLWDRFRLLGSRSDVGDLLAAADVLVFTSRPEGMEGMPASLIEAGMAGVPAVAFDVSGVGEVVVDGETGFLVPAEDGPQMSERVVEILRNDRARRSLGRRARQRCLDRFAIERVADLYLEEYSRIVSRAATRGGG